MAEYAESLFPQIADHKKRAFLASYAHQGNYDIAARAGGVTWRTHYNWMKADQDYAAAFAEAKRLLGDFLEQEAIRRATQGVDRKIFHQGNHVDNQTEYSDTLLIFLLKGAKPEVYQDRVKQEVTGGGGQPLAITLVSYRDAANNA